MLFHIAYASTATVRMGPDELLAMLRHARQNNAKLGISGVLLHDCGHFFQVIEGPHDAVQGLYRSIQKDVRHSHLVKIVEEPIFQRDFPDWSMGLAELDRRGEMPPDALEGLNDYLHHGTSFSQLTPGRALKLMQAFRLGRWRQHIEAGLA